MNADEAPTPLTRRYVALTEKLISLSIDDDATAEHIRDGLDKAWYAMTEEERDWLDGLSTET